MIQKVEDQTQLQKILCGDHEIIGNDWIANMVKVYESNLDMISEGSFQTFSEDGGKIYLFSG
jgi:hypothetical protein